MRRWFSKWWPQTRSAAATLSCIFNERAPLLLGALDGVDDLPDRDDGAHRVVGEGD